MVPESAFAKGIVAQSYSIFMEMVDRLELERFLVFSLFFYYIRD